MTGYPRIVRLSDVERERVTWLWRGRLPFGKLATLDGMPGLGKSTVTLEIAARATTGRPMPGEYEGWPAMGVVLLSAEDGIADTIRPRVQAADGDLSRVVVFDEMYDDVSPRPPVIPDDLPALKQMVIDHEAGLVIVDPLFAFFSSDSDSYRDQDVRRVLHRVKMLAEETGAAVMIVRHPTKGARGSAIYAGGGSIGVVGAARVGLFMGRDPNDDERTILAVAKSNLGAIPPSLALRLVEHPTLEVAQIEWDGESPLTADELNAPPRSNKLRDQIAAAILTLLEDQSLTQAAIIEALGRPAKDRTVRRALEGLVREGDVAKTPDGAYFRIKPTRE